MSQWDLVIQNGTIVDEHSSFQANIAIRDERIHLITSSTLTEEARQVIDASGLHVLPGIIDSHVHVRDPGLTEKEDFTTATQAAAAGGVTLVMCQPTTNPPTTSPETLERRIELGEAKACVDFCIQVGIDPAKLDELPAIDTFAPVSYEVFLQDFPAQMKVEGMAELWEILESLQSIGALVCIYRGDEELKNYFLELVHAEGRKDTLAWNDSRPSLLESMGVGKVLPLLRSLKVPVHFRQISTKEALALIVQAQENDPALSLSIEVTPHNLLMTREDALEIGPSAKVIPPQRSEEDLAALWETISRKSVMTIVGTDHAPHPARDKDQGRDDIWKAPSGFPGVQTLVPLMLNQVTQGKLDLHRFVELCASDPARRFGIYPRKGSMQVGSDADFTVVDLNKETTIRSKDQLTKAGFTPFDGWRVKGFPVMTILRGHIVMKDGEIFPQPGMGNYVKRCV